MLLSSPQNTLPNPQQLSTVLIIDATLPTYDQDSGSLRLFHLIKMLVKLGYQVTFFAAKIHQSHFKYQQALETTLGIEVFNGEITEMLSTRTFTFAWVCRVLVAHHYIPFLRLLSPHTKIFYDTVDIHYLRELRQAKIEDNPRLAEQALRTKRQELSNCLLADGVITVTADDGHHLQQELPQLKFSVIPNIHQPFQQSPLEFEQRNGLVFIGHYRHKPNEDAVCYFVETVLPKIHAQLLNIKLYLIGSQMTAKILALESISVKIIGWVDKVEPELAQRRVFVSYLRYGAGMKGKIGQALSSGLPVVTTMIGAEGMGLTDGETALIADDPDRFADAVCRLYQDSVLWKKLSRQGQNYIEQQCGETAVFDKLRRLLASYKVLPSVASIFSSLVRSHRLAHSLKNSSTSPNINKILVGRDLTLPKFIDTPTFNPIHLPNAPQPRVSIIIPVFEQVLYTYNCLLTIQNCEQDISKEVIIINNASNDKTSNLLAQLQGAFTILNNSENHGFVQACRQGAEIAKGEFILFLNNDTQVMPGWLSNMLNVMDSQPEIGITGAKLIYPNGRLQEAGGIIFNDGSGYNYGRSQNPTLPQFNHSREVDYCSGACLMIRQKLWQQLGGFDLRYAPAYYEDTDLCFAARQAGYKVFYCHNAQIVHHEGITAGTDINTGYKKFQAINRQKFQQKWQKVLSNHFPPHTSPERAAFRLVEKSVPSLIPMTRELSDNLSNVYTESPSSSSIHRMQREVRKDFPFQTPRYAQIEMTTTCNQRCFFCPVSVAKRPKSKLSLEKLDKIITGLRRYPIETISIAGFSEPTYDKQIVEKVKLIQKAGFTILFYTNGSGLKPTLTDELLKARVSRFTLNLSTLDEIQYEQTRGSKDLKNVIPNIDYLLTQVQTQSQTTEVILIILGALDKQHGTNIHKIIQQFAYSKIPQFRISPHGDYAGETTHHVLPKQFYHQNLRGCAREYQNQWLHFTAAGDAILCCQDYYARYKMGHIDDASVAQIYQGEKITQWRNWISGTEEAPEDFICRYCLFALTDESYIQRIQKLFCQSCVLPNMLGIENACQRCEVRYQIEKWVSIGVQDLYWTSKKPSF